MGSMSVYDPARRPAPVRSSSSPFDDVMTSAHGRFAPRAKIRDELAGILWFQAFVPLVIHHDDRCAIARTKALHFDERERSGCIGLAGRQAQRRRQFLG